MPNGRLRQLVVATLAFASAFAQFLLDLFDCILVLLVMLNLNVLYEYLVSLGILCCYIYLWEISLRQNRWVSLLILELLIKLFEILKIQFDALFQVYVLYIFLSFLGVPGYGLHVIFAERGAVIGFTHRVA